MFKTLKAIGSEIREATETTPQDFWRRFSFELSMPEAKWRGLKDLAYLRLEEVDPAQRPGFNRRIGQIDSFRRELKEHGWTPPEHEPEGGFVYPDYVAQAAAYQSRQAYPSASPSAQPRTKPQTSQAYDAPAAVPPSQPQAQPALQAQRPTQTPSPPKDALSDLGARIAAAKARSSGRGKAP